MKDEEKKISRFEKEGKKRTRIYFMLLHFFSCYNGLYYYS